MSGFGFNIILGPNDFNTITIQPPHSLFALKEVAKEKFNSTKFELFYNNVEDEQIELSNETDYFDMVNYVSSNELNEVLITMSSDDKQKKKTANRKNSRASKPLNKIMESSGGIRKQSNVEDGCLNDFFEAEDEQDLRNLKQNDLLEEGVKYSKHNYNIMNQYRIACIKEKKEIMRIEAEKKHKDKLEISERIAKENQEIVVDSDFGIKNKKNKMKKMKNNV